MDRSFFEGDFDPAGICFGMDRETDERSLVHFLRLFVSPALLEALIPRLSDHDITETVDFITRLMKKHLQEEEYHTLFLKEE